MHDFYTVRASEPEPRLHIVTIEGAGAADPARVLGQGVEITRSAAGVYKVTWSRNPGVFVGFCPGLGAATPGNVKNHSIVRDEYDAATRSIEVSFFDAAGAAHDLAADEYFDLFFYFKDTDI